MQHTANHQNISKNRITWSGPTHIFFCQIKTYMKKTFGSGGIMQLIFREGEEAWMVRHNGWLVAITADRVYVYWNITGRTSAGFVGGIMK